MGKYLPSPELLNKILRYDPETGELFWKPRDVSFFKEGKKSASHACNAWNSKNANKHAFTADDSHGYKHGRIFGTAYQAHRVVWAMSNGEWPPEFIDHINGIKNDNRITNLRLASFTDNNRNMRKSRRNKSGCVGVFLHKPTGKWIASIGCNGKSVHLGYFSEKQEAIATRKKAEINYGYHKNHGKNMQKPSVLLG
jgi:hypothetical protein